jgi:glycosyltransferase involved in cell wall biosynthesis
LPYIYLSNAVTTVSKPLATTYERQYRRFVHYLPNGVESETPVDLAAAAALLQAHGVEMGTYILFAAGRIMATKGCHVLLEAFQTLPTDVKLVVVGDASHVPAYAAKLLELADDRVRMIPFVADKATLFGLVRAARFFVFPSTVEAMSMMLLEVASLGVPIVASDIPENTVVLPEQALFFHSEDVMDLRAKVQWALDHPTDMATLAQAAHTWVHDHYAWGHIVKQYEQLYVTLANRR